MNVANDELYVDWMSKWRMWKKAWCENDEPVVDFYVKFICKGGIFRPTDHADFASEVCIVGSSRIDKSGVIQVSNGAVVLPTITVTPTTSFGIVTLRLSFFSRPEILTIAVVLEKLGHGVLHDNGRVVSNSTSYPNDDKSPRKMPFRDDPVWAIIEDEFF